MKKIENNFAVTGFVAKDAEVRQFTTTSVARFPLAVARQEKNGEETKRISAFMNIEAWRKNENTGSFDQLTKGQRCLPWRAILNPKNGPTKTACCTTAS